MADTAELELAQFRSQWQQEVTEKARQQQQQPPPSIAAIPPAAAGPSRRRHSITYGATRPANFGHARTKSSVSHVDDTEDGDMPETLPGDKREDAWEGTIPAIPSHGREEQAPKSAMEHFEKAIEREDQGILGDSLNLYRKAYRMDPKIDSKYREKYYPRAPAPAPSSGAQSASKGPNTAHHSSHDPPPAAPVAAAPPPPITINSLIAGFSSLRIQANPLPTFAPLKSGKAPESAPEGQTTPEQADPEPEPERGFSLLARLPQEIVLHILREVAYTDIASFARCALVCKSLAFTVATEEAIWKDACHHPRWGFPGQAWDWKCGVLGEDLPASEEEEEEPSDSDPDPEFYDVVDGQRVPKPPHRPSAPPPLTQLLPTYKNSYKTMFSTRPRIRFNGVYISTCNYIRPGAWHASSSTTATGAAPVHIVTYYRYLRFFPCGTCLSLLTTQEPSEIVYHLSKPTPGKLGALVAMLPWARHVLRGRWRIDTGDSGDVDVETECASGEKYLFRMGLSVKSTGARGGRGRINKLAWRGFWSWNRLTDDVAEFSLRNDKPFFWSRVARFDREVLEGAWV